MFIPKNLDMSNRYGVVKYVNLNKPYTTFREKYYLKTEE